MNMDTIINNNNSNAFMATLLPHITYVRGSGLKSACMPIPLGGEMVNGQILLIVLALFFPASIAAQVHFLPTNQNHTTSVVLGVNANYADLKKGEFAVTYENENEVQVATLSTMAGGKAGIEKGFKKTPFTLSVNYFGTTLIAGLLDDNEVGLTKNPLEQVFLVISRPRERNITSVRQFSVSLKTSILGASLRKRATPGMYVHLLTGIGRVYFAGEEVVFLDPPFEETETWKEQHTALNVGGEIQVFPIKKSDLFSFHAAVENQFSSNSQRLKPSMLAINFGFRITF